MSDIQQFDGCDSVSTSSTDSHSDTDSEEEIDDEEVEDDMDNDESFSIISVQDAQEHSEDEDDHCEDEDGHDDGLNEDQHYNAQEDDHDDEQGQDNQSIPVHITNNRCYRDNVTRTQVLKPVVTLNTRKEASMLLPKVAVTNF